MLKEGTLHRNSQKRFYGEDKIYYVVTKTKNNFPYFKEFLFCDLMIENIKLCKELKPFKLFAFSIIYDHLNLLLKPEPPFNISQIMHAIKRHFSRNANLIIDVNNTPLNEGAVCKPRLHLDAHEFNIKLIDYRKQFIRQYSHPQFAIPLFQWQKSFRDHVIRGEKDFYTHWRYTVYNPLKHGLPDDWAYTSLNHEDMIDYF